MKDNKTEEHVAIYRGTIIHWALEIEKQIGEIISSYFCGKNDIKKKEFLYMVLSKESYGFSPKIECLYLIIDSHYPETNKKFPNLKKSLTYILDTRNHCAHRNFIHSNEGEDINRPIFTFQHYKLKDGKIEDAPKPIKVNLGEIGKFMKSLEIILAALTYVSRAVKSNK